MIPTLTIFSCPDPEAATIAALVAQQEADEREQDAVLDLRSRLSDGPCDCCREPSAAALVLVGGEALCADCCAASGIDYNEAIERAPAGVA